MVAHNVCRRRLTFEVLDENAAVENNHAVNGGDRRLRVTIDMNGAALENCCELGAVAVVASPLLFPLQKALVRELLLAVFVFKVRFEVAELVLRANDAKTFVFLGQIHGIRLFLSFCMVSVDVISQSFDAQKIAWNIFFSNGAVV